MSNELCNSALRAEPASQLDASPSTPVAWAVFADNGHLRLWSRKFGEAQRVAEACGKPLVPLYTHPGTVTPEVSPATRCRAEGGDGVP